MITSFSFGILYNDYSLLNCTMITPSHAMKVFNVSRTIGVHCMTCNQTLCHTAALSLGSHTSWIHNYYLGIFMPLGQILFLSCLSVCLLSTVTCARTFEP